MTIETYNDGKGKPQSWMVSADLNGGVCGRVWSLSLNAYGATEEESKKNLELAARYAVNEIAQAFGLKLMKPMNNEAITKASQTVALLIGDLRDVHKLGIKSDPMLEILALDLLEQAQKLKDRINLIAQGKNA